MVSEKLTHAELAGRLDDALERVIQGDRFMIERDGEVIATMSPADHTSGITLRELIAREGDLMPPGDSFADDLEAVQAAQALVQIPIRENDDGNR
jgi:hypothetical protein